MKEGGEREGAEGEAENERGGKTEGGGGRDRREKYRGRKGGE